MESEPVRRTLASILQWGGWFGSLGVIVWATLNFDPSEGHFAPQWVGLSVIFMVGVSIAATSARARMRLSDTIVSAFKAGFDSARLRSNEAEDRTANRLNEAEGRAIGRVEELHAEHMAHTNGRGEGGVQDEGAEKSDEGSDA